MTRVRVLAPALVDFRAPLGAFRYTPGQDQEAFWSEVERWGPGLLVNQAPDPAGQPLKVHARWRSPRGRFNRYQQISTDTLERPVEAVVLELALAHLYVALPASLDPAAPFSISCRVYDHSTFIVEAEAGLLLPSGLVADGVEDFLLDQVQAELVTWGEQLAREIHDRYLVPLLEQLRRRDRSEEIVAPAARGAAAGGAEFGSVLWVARSLVVGSADPLAAEIRTAWVKDVAGGGAAQLAPDADGRAHLIRWLNYLFVPPSGASPSGADVIEDHFAAEWEGLRLAQYFYAALENIDVQLERVLARSLAPYALATVKDLKGELEECSRRAEFIVMLLRDTAKYLTRPVQVELDDILDYWDFGRVVEEPVAMKVQACERRLRELSERRSARSAIFTDVILLAIGITSILGTTLALTEFGRTMAVDPGMAGYDTGRNRVIEWIAAQPADLLLFASAGVSLMLSLVYFYFRRNNSS